jgi:hypothetical protein
MVGGTRLRSGAKARHRHLLSRDGRLPCTWPDTRPLGSRGGDASRVWPFPITTACGGLWRTCGMWFIPLWWVVSARYGVSGRWLIPLPTTSQRWWPSLWPYGCRGGWQVGHRGVDVASTTATARSRSGGLMLVRRPFPRVRFPWYLGWHGWAPERKTHAFGADDGDALECY